jgi:L,D-transpeptidase catalytic domain
MFRYGLIEKAENLAIPWEINMQHKTAFSALLVALLLIVGAGLLWLPQKISGEAYRAAYAALDTYRTAHPEERIRSIAVVDFTKPSCVKRMAIIDLASGEESFYRVAHAKNSGELYATHFSNAPESGMSSPGLYRVLEAYSGDHGKAVRLEGLEGAVNDNAFSRDIVIHSANYVSLGYILLNLVTFNGPRIGRSNGCFVVSTGDIDSVTQKLSSKGALYAWTKKSAGGKR